MTNRMGLVTGFANFFLWFLITMGLLFLVLVIPVNSYDLQDSYSEYAGDGLTIQLLLSSITVAGQAILFFISVLLNKVKKQELLTKQSVKWVKALVGSAFIAAVMPLLLLNWLTAQETAPPLVALVLIGASVICATVGLVTLALLSALQEAIKQGEELEGVI